MTTPGSADRFVPPRRGGGAKLVVGLSIGFGLLGLGFANAHLVYVAVTSQPDCVAHLKERGDRAGQAMFRAARSAC
ncbi:hypothetical protein [Limobrevibacterium gyesilva]|uniref:Uncharacterized protein n=1 Tax=Limobrevibacterium gyesilva TaxID=2991712 RepID=A0AA41YHY2_9PROT|nr:hypothetical protein [Limobrevibacterium gyesilva]MCW3473184.1 hypothetical protein [Limobrevibacterium gyesilva]